jgi:hypothetical protein
LKLDAISAARGNESRGSTGRRALALSRHLAAEQPRCGFLRHLMPKVRAAYRRYRSAGATSL